MLMHYRTCTLMRDIPLKFIVFACMWLSLPLWGGDISVVVSKDTAIPKASKLEVMRIFLGKKSSMGGVKLKPVGYSDESMPIVKRFRKEVLKKSPTKFKVYWSSRIFTGKGVPPKSVADNQKEMVAYIKDNPGAIAIIDSSKLTKDLLEVYRHAK